jgi:hypothetical protein
MLPVALTLCLSPTPHGLLFCSAVVYRVRATGNMASDLTQKPAPCCLIRTDGEYLLVRSVCTGLKPDEG